jgi:flavin-dependent dehydrogenase
VPQRDVIIIGGGPAGSSLAGLLALRGRKPLVIERDAFPRFHIGESLLPQACDVFDKLGVRDAFEQRFIRKYGATFVDAPTERINRYVFAEAFDARQTYAYQVQRAEFDELLLDRAVELGAELRQPCKVTEVLLDGERACGVRVTGDDGDEELHAPWVIDCTGRGAMLSGKLSGRARLAGLDTSSLFAHYRGVEREQGDLAGNIVIVIFEHGWGWLIPFLDGTTSAGVVLSRAWMNQRERGEGLEAFFERSVAEAPWLAQRLADAERISEVRATADFSYEVGKLGGPGWLAVGDACGFIDPLFSTGAHLAICGADLAADTLVRVLDDPSSEAEALADYERWIRDATSLFLGAVRAFYYGEFREMLFASNQRATLRQVITSILGGDVVHREPPSWVRFVRGRFDADVPAADVGARP